VIRILRTPRYGFLALRPGSSRFRIREFQTGTFQKIGKSCLPLAGSSFHAPTCHSMTDQAIDNFNLFNPFSLLQLKHIQPILFSHPAKTTISIVYI
jgi:hypothetical protein